VRKRPGRKSTTTKNSTSSPLLEVSTATSEGVSTGGQNGKKRKRITLVSRGGKENQEPRNATMQDQGSAPGISPSSMEGLGDLPPRSLSRAASFAKDVDCLCPEPMEPKA
jgi:hypothetical protein